MPNYSPSEVSCPWCGAGQTAYCSSPSGKLVEYHRARWKEAEVVYDDRTNRDARLAHSLKHGISP